MQFVCKYSQVFIKNEIMKVKLLISTSLVLLIHLAASAAPARKGSIRIEQPDGSGFHALIMGDEFMKITMTTEGQAIIQGKDGWWCYAYYDEEGRKYSTGNRVGKTAPADILSNSRNIPYSGLAERADHRRRRISMMEEEPIVKRILKGRKAATKAEEDTETKHGLVILAEFKDKSFKYTKEDFVKMLTQDGYSVNGATGCAREYFNDQFEGLMKFDFQVSDIVTLPKRMSYYGGNDIYGDDSAPAEMVVDACELLKDKIDFTLYDDDGDRAIDNVFIIFAGMDEADYGGDDCIWSHSWYVYSGAGIRYEVDGMLVDRYACSSELTKVNERTRICGIGTFCHEFTHTLGLPDFYDTDYEGSGGMSAGLWCRTSLMDSGNQNNNGNTPPYLNAVEREILGLSDPDTLVQSKTYTLEPIHLNGQSYKLLTETKGEYYLFECRTEEKWDEYIGGSGMLVYHIDRSRKALESWDITNLVNANPKHQMADILEADNRKDTFSNFNDYAYALSNSISGIFFPYGNVESLTYGSSPGFTTWYGSAGSDSISGIRREGSNIKFSYVNGEVHETPPTAEDIKVESFADAAILNFISNPEYEGEATVKWYRPGQEGETRTVTPYSPGKYALIIEGLESSGKTYTAEITFVLEGLEGECRTISFMTKRMPSVKWPYIYLNSVERSEDGSFNEGTRIPLRVYNASEAEEITWMFEGSDVTHDGDGYFTLPGEGVLQATVHWEDGSTDILQKNIKISNGL